MHLAVVSPRAHLSVTFPWCHPPIAPTAFCQYHPRFISICSVPPAAGGDSVLVCLSHPRAVDRGRLVEQQVRGYRYAGSDDAVHDRTGFGCCYSLARELDHACTVLASSKTASDWSQRRVFARYLPNGVINSNAGRRTAVYRDLHSVAVDANSRFGKDCTNQVCMRCDLL